MNNHRPNACKTSAGQLILCFAFLSPVAISSVHAAFDHTYRSPHTNRSTSALLRKTSQILSNGDPVWILQVVDQTNQVTESFEVVSGKKDSQLKNRNTPDNGSPLPSGIYSISTANIERGPFPNPELGTGYWIPLNPLFPTNRTDLGIHQDPSWGLLNKHSGTAGCIGMKSAEDTASLVKIIKSNKISRLIVL